MGVEKAAKAVGGSIESFYWSFGDDDFLVIADVPGQGPQIALVEHGIDPGRLILVEFNQLLSRGDGLIQAVQCFGPITGG